VSNPDWDAAAPHIEALRKLNLLPVLIHVVHVHERIRGISDEEAMTVLDWAYDEYSDFGIKESDILFAIDALYTVAEDDDDEEDEAE
jgi:hypothetical protein